MSKRLMTLRQIREEKFPRRPLVGFGRNGGGQIPQARRFRRQRS